MRLLRHLSALISLIAVALGVTLPGFVAHTANPNDFTFESYHADYTLERDEEGRSALTTVETLVALFPEYDQNRGIQRAIPHSYNGHETDLTVVSVTDEHGAERPFDTWLEGDFMIVQVAVPQGEFEHGRTVYTITYTQRDVTHAFADTRADEFYWDLNGTGWGQPFGTVSATLRVAGELGDALTGQQACYRGAEGSDQQCEISLGAGADGPTFSVSEHGLAPRENVTIAVGFEPGTFEERPVPWYVNNPFLLWSGIGSGLLAVGTFVTSVIRNARGARTGDPIIAQYEPPAEVSLAVAATIVKREAATPTATLLDLAVRGNIRILHNREQDLFGAQLLHYENLTDEERAFAKKLFTGRISTEAGPDGAQERGTRGAYLWFTRKDHTLGDAAVSLRGRAATASQRSGYRRRAPKWPMVALFVLLGLAVGLTSLYFYASGNDIAGGAMLFVGGYPAFFFFVIGTMILARQRPVTMLGAKLRDQLEGLKEYISLAEADRLRVLQSLSGAEVTSEHVVKVYERLLPYAAMWGMEKEWQRELAKYYVESPPQWAAGDTSNWVANAAVFDSLNRSVIASRPTPSASSFSSGGGGWSSSGGSSFSSGGSSGGGFSGGGGGGGGGRGI